MNTVFVEKNFFHLTMLRFSSLKNTFLGKMYFM